MNFSFPRWDCWLPCFPLSVCRKDNLNCIRISCSQFCCARLPFWILYTLFCSDMIWWSASIGKHMLMPCWLLWWLVWRLICFTTQRISRQWKYGRFSPSSKPLDFSCFSLELTGNSWRVMFCTRPINLWMICHFKLWWSFSSSLLLAWISLGEASTHFLWICTTKTWRQTWTMST